MQFKLKSILSVNPLYLFLYMAVVASCYAEDSIQNVIQKLPEITVSASRNESYLADMTTHTTIITIAEIQNSPAQSLDQFLKTIPGFNFSGAPTYLSDPTGTQTKIRGLGNAKVLVLLDGIPILDPFYLTTQWFRVPMSGIERIEIIRGGDSSLWGSMAVGGVVNVITKTPKTNSADISFSAGSFGTSNVSATKNVIIADALKMSLSANHFETSGYAVTPSQFLYLYPNKKPPTDVTENFQLSAYFSPSTDLRGYMRAGYYSQDQNLYGTFGRNYQLSPNISLGFTRQLNDSSTIDIKAWAQNVLFNKTNGSSCYLVSASSCLNGDSSTLPSVAQSKTLSVVNYFKQQGAQGYQERGVSTVYSKSFNHLVNNVQVGADYRRLSVNDTEQYYGAPTSTVTQNLTGSAYGQGSQDFTGAFVQTKVSPLDSTQITLSGRLDNWANTNRIYNLTTTANGTSPGSGSHANLSKQQFNPSLGVHYDFNDNIDLRVATYRSFRAPGLNNQTRSYSTTIANPDLIPETMTGWELGSNQRWGAWSSGFTYFHNSLSNMIATSTYTIANTLPQPVINLCSTAATNATPNLTNCGSSVSFYSNNQNGESNGVELTQKWKARQDLTFDAFYTYIHTYLTSKGTGVTTLLNTQLVGIPRSTVSLSGTYSANSKLQAYLQMYYIGALSFYQSSSLNAIQGSNTIFNANVNYKIQTSVETFVSVINMFNRHYQDNTYTATSPQGQTLSPPRTINVGLRLHF